MTTFPELVSRKLTQTLSLPERTIRSIAAIVGGVSSLLTETIFPESLRGTTTYQVTIGMMQQYILEKIAGMNVPAQTSLSPDFAQRKMAGTALEAAGLLTVGFSPLWVFAIAGDAAGGSKLYLQRLVRRLKENALIPQDEEAEDLADLLEAVQEAAGRSALAVDMPPLSRESVVHLAQEIKDGYAHAFASTANLLPSLDELWGRMEQLTQREGISLERLGGAMAMEAAAWSKKSAGMMRAAGRTGLELLDEKILESYRTTLARASEQGVDHVLREHMRPFLSAAKGHFDLERPTWTENVLRGKKKRSAGDPDWSDSDAG